MPAAPPSARAGALSSRLVTRNSGKAELDGACVIGRDVRERVGQRAEACRRTPRAAPDSVAIFLGAPEMGVFSRMLSTLCGT